MDDETRALIARLLWWGGDNIPPSLRAEALRHLQQPRKFNLAEKVRPPRRRESKARTPAKSALRVRAPRQPKEQPDRVIRIQAPPFIRPSRPPGPLPPNVILIMPGQPGTYEDAQRQREAEENQPDPPSSAAEAKIHAANDELYNNHLKRKETRHARRS